MTGPREWFGDLAQRAVMFAMREWLRKAAAETHGALCPVCERFDKVYVRRINRASINNLTRLYRHARANGLDAFYHYSAFMPGEKHSDFAKFAFLNLIERADADTDITRTSGCYRITTQGRLFVEGYVAIPATITLYHNKMIEHSKDAKRISDFWPDFDFAALMERSPDHAA